MRAASLPPFHGDVGWLMPGAARPYEIRRGTLTLTLKHLFGGKQIHQRRKETVVGPTHPRVTVTWCVQASDNLREC